MIWKYFGVTKNTFKNELSYRVNAMMWSLTNVLELVVFYFLWKAIYSYAGVDIIGGFTFKQMFFYYVTSFVFWLPISADYIFSQDVKNGTLIGYFIRPMNILNYFASLQLGQCILSIITYILPVLVVAVIFFGYVPFSLMHLILGTISFILCIILLFLFYMTAVLSTFWFQDYFGTMSLLDILVGFSSGGMIPLTLFPVIIQQILGFTPFPAMGFYHITIIIGSATIPMALRFIVTQLAWIVVFYILFRIIFKFGSKKFTGAGT